MMERANMELMREFSLDNLPNLDAVVLAALELFDEQGLPALDLGTYKRPLLVGSGNAAVTGRILFEGSDAVFADEGTYEGKLRAIPSIDGAILISASGKKHAVTIARDLKARGIEARLLTCNPGAPSREFVDPDKFFVFPRNREPYTYNTSTYMGMILGKTRENPASTLDFTRNEVAPLTERDMSVFDAFYLIVPSRFDSIREMFLTKFDELFGPLISGRVFTMEQTKHAKTVVTSEKEMFISFGEPNDAFGSEDARLTIPLPADADYGAMMAIGYFVIGRLQSQFPAYFKNAIAAYTEAASALFGQDLKPIVE
jgi:hypothetical protein